MHAPEPPSAPDDPPPENAFPADTLVAGIYPSHRDAFEHSFVLLAMGAECWLVAAPDGHHLRVTPDLLPEARHQLALFDHESTDWPPRAPAELAFAGPAANRRIPLGPLVWLLAIIAVFHAQSVYPELAESAALDASRVFAHGELWRAFTAL
ncbi:MAG: hypothetical protein MUE42_12905, partial [Opitutaceae bacterium]|nr:hypothetical protein [Opitutaceae bacterium]